MSPNLLANSTSNVGASAKNRSGRECAGEIRSFECWHYRQFRAKTLILFAQGSRQAGSIWPGIFYGQPFVGMLAKRGLAQRPDLVDTRVDFYDYAGDLRRAKRTPKSRAYPSNAETPILAMIPALG